MSSRREVIAANIKLHRKKAGLTVDEVGEAVGKSGKTISAWEVGRGQPDADETILLCRRLGIDLMELYGERQETDTREERLLEIFRSLTPDGRVAMMATAEGIHAAFADRQG